VLRSHTVPRGSSNYVIVELCHCRIMSLSERVVLKGLS